MPTVKGKNNKNNKNNKNTLELTPTLLAAGGLFGGEQGEVDRKSKCYVELKEVYDESFKQAEASEKDRAKLNEVAQRAAALRLNTEALGDEIDLRTTRGAMDLSATIALEAEAEAEPEPQPAPEPQTAAAPEAEASAAGNLAGVQGRAGEMANKGLIFAEVAKRLSKEQKKGKKKEVGCCGSRP